MDLCSATHPCIFRVFILFTILTQPVCSYNDQLIFSQCPNQTSPKPAHSQLLSKLFQEFTDRSSKTSFFESIVADEESSISGTVQCRMNLSPDECRNCVTKFQGLSEDLCGKAMPARIQLSGCYARYQLDSDDYAEPGPNELVHKACSKSIVKKYGFEEMKYEAVAALESCVIIGNGFCEMTYEAVHVVAQCAGSLRACDCGRCVSDAVQIAVDECRYAVSGEVYLDSCFISFDYYRDHRFGGYSFDGGNSPKLAAIVVGSLVAVFLGFAFCYFMRSSCGKKERWYF